MKTNNALMMTGLMAIGLLALFLARNPSAIPAVPAAQARDMTSAHKLAHRPGPPTRTASPILLAATNQAQAQAKHLAAYNFLRSNVKDTSAVRRMAKRLLENGYGIEYLRPAFMAAWNVRNLDPAYTAFYLNDELVLQDIPQLQQLRQEAREEGIQKLKALGITDEALLAELVDIRPIAFWEDGGLIRSMKQFQVNGLTVNNGREYYSEEDVIAYIERTPVNDPPVQRTGEKTKEERQRLNEWADGQMVAMEAKYRGRTQPGPPPADMQ